MERAIRLFGGPKHGETVTVRGNWIQYVAPKPFDYGRGTSSRTIATDFDVVNYKIEKWARSLPRPALAVQELEIGVAEGYTLRPVDEAFIRDALQFVRPRFWPASFLRDFDAWWIETVYRVTGDFPASYQEILWLYGFRDLPRPLLGVLF